MSDPPTQQIPRQMRGADASQRIEVVDMLRGYALMGLFFIHVVEYYELYWYSPGPGPWRAPEPNPVNTLTFALFSGKAYALFALLFGVSFFIIMTRQARKGVDFRLRFIWRLSLLFLLGYIHGLIYGGDILQILAVTGLLLVPLYHRSDSTVLWVSLFFLIQGPALMTYAVVNAVSGLSYAQPLHWTTEPPVREVWAHGSLLDVLRVNMWQAVLKKWTFLAESGRLWNMIGLSLLGFVLARIGFFTDVARYKSIYQAAFAGALVPAFVLQLFGQYLIGLAPGSESKWIAQNVVTVYTNNLWTAASLLALMLLYQLRPLRRALSSLAPCGRMSLTVYVSQSFVLVPFFYGFGAGAYAFIGQPMSFALAAALWCLQMGFAHYWMKHYHYGPLEWLWRSGTWLRRDIPFRKQDGDTELTRRTTIDRRRRVSSDGF